VDRAKKAASQITQITGQIRQILLQLNDVIGADLRSSSERSVIPLLNSIAQQSSKRGERLLRGLDHCNDPIYRRPEIAAERRMHGIE
jgi:hypothetical protein